jgi:hypothetical protein
MEDYIFTTLNDPSAAFGTFATGINKSGQIVGYYIDAPPTAFRSPKTCSTRPALRLECGL